MKKSKEILLDIGVFALVVLVGIYIVMMTRYGKDNDLLENMNAHEIREGWTVIDENKSEKPITLPYNYEGISNEEVTIVNTLPEEISDNTYITFRTKRQNVKVFIGGELRKEFYQSNDIINTGRPVSRYMYVSLKREDAGKKISITGVRETKGTRKFTRVYLGDRAELAVNYLKTQKYSVILAFIFCVIGFLSVITGVGMRIATKNDVRIDTMGWTMLLISVWDMTQSDYRDMLFGNITLISAVPAITLLIIPIPLALYLTWLQKNRFQKIYYIFMSLSFADLLFWTVTGIFKITSFTQAVAPSFVFLYTLMAIFVVTVVIDYKNGRKTKEYISVIIGMMCTGFFGMLQMLRYYSPSESEDGAFLCFGFALLTCASFIQALMAVFKMNGEKKAALMMADMKTQFLATMSHEIRTPINAVLGMNEAIIRESKEEEIKKYASDVDIAGRLLLSLVNDILDFSKLDSGKMSLTPSEYKVKQLLSFCYSMVEKKAIEKHLECRMKVDPEVPAVLFGDEIRMQQVIINILNNAVKYTEKGYVELGLGYERIDSDKINLIISVSDSGQGIKEENVGKLFSAFTRVDEMKNRNIEGTGLGLAITAKLVELMQGKVDVKSKYGEGSTFTITIPQKTVSDEKIGTVSLGSISEAGAIKEKEEFKAPGAKLLVTDDVTLNIKVVKAFLKESGMEIDSAESGDECLKLTKEKKYDIILLDHMMPQKDGIQTLVEMKEDPANLNHDTPIIMLTANAMGGAKEEYLDKGFADYLSKPLNISELFRVIGEHLNAE